MSSCQLTAKTSNQLQRQWFLQRVDNWTLWPVLEGKDGFELPLFFNLHWFHLVITVQQKNLQSLMIEIYKNMNHLNPSYIWEFCVKKDIPYNLRTKELCRLPSEQSHRYGLCCLSFRGTLLWNILDDELQSHRYGLCSLSFRGSLLWNTLDDELKRADTLRSLKRGIKEWDGKRCNCLISK